MATKLEESAAITINRLHPVIGAEIKNVDLSQPLADDTIGQIIDAWHAHSVLLFRDQNLSEDDQIRFAAHFGPVADRVQPVGGDPLDAPDWNNLMLITDHVDANGKPIGSLGHGEMTFHTDKCYRERPHRTSFLYGIEIPSVGGHTKFASLYAAYDNMPDDLKRRLDDVFVMQGHEYSGYGRLKLDVNLEDIHHFRQPLILTVPGSNRKSLYLSRLNTMWIEGMDRGESEAILGPLFDLTEDPATMYEHVWRKGDLLMWDNLACLHARTDWPDGEKRMLRRCTTVGDRLW
ncbi:MAG: TauD/TfdA family dioxygenase [Proteobacteria bacterium]|nr:TauD/TfdA family dioxygenase [Pseudomonadota bacterium]MDA1324044.1 TauD/TfdA family dioxygenase [Pseudomonadota bacterium]